MTTLANDYRPKTFAEVVGQEAEARVVKEMLKKGWKPNAIMATGPFGTGKTTFARLIARAMLCDDPQYGADQFLLPEADRGKPYEPCGVCSSCKSIDRDNHPNYIEVDAASNGLIADVRTMKDQISYRTGSKVTIVTYDESHGLSVPAQNALLATLEEGGHNILFIFATTDAPRMLPTIRSRCVELHLKLLKQSQIKERLLVVAAAEGILIEDKAAAVIATYVRGHVRDSLVLLEQLSKTVDKGETVSETLVRTYLRLDRQDEIYTLLTQTDKKAGVEQLEQLLCNYAPAELSDLIGEVLVNAYKVKLGMDQFTQTDTAWLRRVIESRGEVLLDQAEAVLSLHTDFATITYGMAAFAKILFEEAVIKTTGPSRSLMPGSAPAPAGTQQATFRKPGR